MKKILFLLNEYSPEFSANSSCVANVITELKNNNKVDVLTFLGRDNVEVKQIINGITIHGIKCKIKIDYNKMYSKDCSKINPISFAYKKIRNKLIVSFIWPDFAIANINAYKKKAIQLISKNKYDAVISSSGDFLVQIVGIYIKKKYPLLKWIAYFNDPMPCNNFLYLKAKSTILNLNKQQENVLKGANTILYDLELYKKYIEMFPAYKYKMVPVGIPSLVKLNDYYENNAFDQNKINIIFTGSLYKNMRNPEFLFKIISNSKFPIKLKIYGSGDCVDIINMYTKKSKGKIEYHGQVEQCEARKQMSNADILVNICNDVSEQVPCKLFEYMSTGLPIINIVKNDNDPIVEYINKYGNGINIFEKTDIEQATKILDEFCSNYSYNKVPFEKTRQTFVINTPEYTKNIIESFI